MAPEGHPPTARRAILHAAVVLLAAAVLVVGLWLGGGRPAPAAPGLPQAGAFVAWALPLSGLVVDGAAVGAVGALLVAVVLLPAQETARLSDAAVRCVRAAASWALLWAVAALAALVLTLADIFGQPLARVLSGAVPASYAWSLPQGRALLLVAVLAGTIAAARRVRTHTGATVLLLTAVAALLPPVFTGHAAAADRHALNVATLAVHVIAVAAWVGALLGLLLHARHSGALLATAVPRFSALALGCFFVAGVSGAANAWLHLPSVHALWQSPYGGLLIGKVTALVILGIVGWWHRRHTVPAVVLRERPGPLVCLAAGEVTVMAATIALAVALSRTPPPMPPG